MWAVDDGDMGSWLLVDMTLLRPYSGFSCNGWWRRRKLAIEERILALRNVVGRPPSVLAAPTLFALAPTKYSADTERPFWCA